MAKKFYFKKLSVLVIIFMVNTLVLQGEYISAKSKGQWHDEVEHFYSNARSLRENFNRKSSLCKKLMYDKMNDTGLLDKEKEQVLNEYGILDEQIKTMDESMLNGLEQGEIVCINNIYYQEDKKDELIQMSQDEIDDTIYEKYKENISQVDTDNVLEKAYKLWNQKVSAKQLGYDSSKKETNSGKLQQSIIVTTTGFTNKLHVWYQSTWLDSPHSRGTDFCGAWIQKGTVDTNSVSTEYKCHYQVYNTSMGRNLLVKEEKSTAAPKIERKDARGAIVRKNLFSTWKDIHQYTLTPFKLKWITEYIKIEYDVYLSSGDYQYNNVTGDYWHKTDSTDVNATASFNSNGSISLNFSSSTKSQYTHISPNVSTSFYYTAYSSNK